MNKSPPLQGRKSQLLMLVCVEWEEKEQVTITRPVDLFSEVWEREEVREDWDVGLQNWQQGQESGRTRLQFPTEWLLLT